VFHETLPGFFLFALRTVIWLVLDRKSVFKNGRNTFATTGAGGSSCLQNKSKVNLPSRKELVRASETSKVVNRPNNIAVPATR
jgi:hypothetical protein